MVIKKRVRSAPPAFVGDAEVEDQGHSPHIISQVDGNLSYVLRGLCETGHQFTQSSSDGSS